MNKSKSIQALLLASALLVTTMGSGLCVRAEEQASNENGKLVVYSPQADADRGPWIEQKVKEDLGIEVEFLGADGADISERLIAEKGNPQADVVMGLVQTAMYQLKAEDVLTPYTPSWAEGLPEVYKEKEGYFYSFWQTPIVIGYNPDYVSNPPAEWSDLINEEYNELYFIDSTGKQTIRTYIIGMLWNYYDESTGDITEEGWDFLRDLYSNSRTLPTGQDTDIWALMKSGEMPISLSWFGGVKSKCETYEIPVEYVVPENGTPVVAEAIGMINGCKNEELAQMFIEWWGSPETMAAYANEFGQAPVHPDAIAMCNDEVKEDAEMFTAQDIDWEVAAEKQDEWFEKIELEIMP